MHRSHSSSGRPATPADFNRNGWPTSIGMPGRHHRNPHLEEVKPLLMAVALGDAGDELAIEIVQGGEQGERTVANIVVGLGLDTDNDTQRVSILPHTRLPVRSSSHRNAPTCLLPFLVGGAIVGLVGFLFIDIRAAPDRALTTLGCDAIGP